MPVTRTARIAREKKTIQAMVAIYCRGRHGTRQSLCESCRALLDYALQRLDRCPFGDDKTPCADCEIHCYRADRREEIRDVMRYAGPRMLWRYPILALLHLRDGRTSRPKLRRKRPKSSSSG